MHNELLNRTEAVTPIRKRIRELGRAHLQRNPDPAVLAARNP